VVVALFVVGCSRCMICVLFIAMIVRKWFSVCSNGNGVVVGGCVRKWGCCLMDNGLFLWGVVLLVFLFGVIAAVGAHVILHLREYKRRYEKWLWRHR